MPGWLLVPDLFEHNASSNNVTRDMHKCLFIAIFRLPFFSPPPFMKYDTSEGILYKKEHLTVDWL